MKKGINACCFPQGYTVEKIFTAARQYSFEGVELNMEEPTEEAVLSLGMSEKYWATIKFLSEQNAVPVTGVSTTLHWQYPLTDDNKQTREKGLRIAMEMIDAAAFLGGDTVLVVPGVVTEQVSYKTAYTRALDAFMELKDYAEKKKIMVAVENAWNKFLLSPLEMAEFVDEIGSAYVQAYFDAGNVMQFGYPDHWVEALGSRIAKVHVKDFDVGIGNITGFKPLLQGDVPWKRLMDALNEAGYDGYLVAEVSPYRAHPTQMLADTSAAMDYILSL